MGVNVLTLNKYMIRGYNHARVVFSHTLKLAWVYMVIAGPQFLMHALYITMPLQ